MSAPARLQQLCEDTLAALPDCPERSTVETVRDRLAQPIRVAVAGPVSSGKSTLVNALLGQQVAPVGAGETTQVVTWYRYGVEDRARVHLHDGRSADVPITDGRLPRDLPHRPADVERVTVDLSNERLRALQVVDTPGLNTTSDDLEDASRRLLGVEGIEGRSTRDAVTQVDALVFVLPHLRARDAEVLESSSRLLAGTSLSGLNTLGVLSRIDRLTDGDPWPAAHTLAERLRDQLRSTVSTVIPVIGLLAETVSCGRLTERDAAGVRTIAALGAEARGDALLDAAGFLGSPDVPLDEGARRRLYDRLSLHGLAVALRAVDGGATTAAQLNTLLDRESGFAALTETLDRQLVARADLLTAHTALVELRRLSYGDASGPHARVLAALRDPLERVELDSDLHRLRLMDALAQCYRGELHLPDDHVEQLERLALHGDERQRLGMSENATAEDVVDRALTASSAWVRLSNDPRRSPAERAAARSVRTALELLVSDLTRPVGRPS